MRSNARFGLLFLTHLALLMALVEFNSMLGRAGVSLHLDGFFLVSPAMLLGPIAGGALVGYLALAWDASFLAVPYGLSFIIWLVAYAVLRQFTPQLRPDTRLHLLIVALVSNLGVLLVKGVLLAGASASTLTYWRSWALETSLSTFLIFLGTGWFLALQEKLMRALRLQEGAEAAVGR